MKTTVKTFWIIVYLILTCSVSAGAVSLTAASQKMVATSEVSASLSSCSSNALKQNSSNFANTKFSWTADVELGAKPVSEIYSSTQQRLRRVVEDNLLLRNIFLILSNHENLLVHGRTKQYYSDKNLVYVLTGSDYYIYTLRRILI